MFRLNPFFLKYPLWFLPRRKGNWIHVGSTPIFRVYQDTNFRDFGVIIEPHNKGISDCKHTDKLTLWKQVWDMPTTEVAKLYGFSDRALGKWCVALNIPKPARGFWAKYNSQKFDGQFCPLPN